MGAVVTPDQLHSVVVVVEVCRRSAVTEIGGRFTPCKGVWDVVRPSVGRIKERFEFGRELSEGREGDTVPGLCIAAQVAAS